MADTRGVLLCCLLWLAACSGPTQAGRSGPGLLHGASSGGGAQPATRDQTSQAPRPGPAPGQQIVQGPPPLSNRASILISTGEASPEDDEVTLEARPAPPRISPNQWGRPGKATLEGDVLTGPQPDPRDWSYTGRSPYKVHPITAGRGKGMVLPYPLTFVIKKLGRCKRGKRGHVAVDLGGIGPNYGLGTPVRAMARSKVIRVGLPSRDSDEFGEADVGSGYAYRRGRRLPRSMVVPGYGRVRFFTHDYGRWRSGVVVSTRILGGRYKGYKVRYMHLAAVHPAVKAGGVVEAGQEIALMGCTAILNDLPHVHLDIWTPSDSRRVDPSPILGLRSGRVACRRSRRRRKRQRGKGAAHKKAGSTATKAVQGKATKINGATAP